MTASTLPLQLEDGENNPEYVKVIFITLIKLIDYKQERIEPDIAACKAARTINALRPDNHPKDSYQRKLPPYNFLYGMVVNLVAELKKLDVVTLHIWGKDIRLWTELPLLGPEYRELREQFQKEEFENSGLKVFRDKLEADGVITLFNR